jgi:hypothetical protein
MTILNDHSEVREVPDFNDDECSTCGSAADFGFQTCSYCHNEWCDKGDSCPDHKGPLKYQSEEQS